MHKIKGNRENHKIKMQKKKAARAIRDNYRMSDEELITYMRDRGFLKSKKYPFAHI